MSPRIRSSLKFLNIMLLFTNSLMNIVCSVYLTVTKMAEEKEGLKLGLPVGGHSSGRHIVAVEWASDVVD